MKNPIDPKVAWTVLAVVAVVVLGLFYRVLFPNEVVPESAIKAPPPPGGFPAGSPRATGGRSAAPPPQ